jgi:hypothetical protein
MPWANSEVFRGAQGPGGQHVDPVAEQEHFGRHLIPNFVVGGWHVSKITLGAK